MFALAHSGLAALAVRRQGERLLGGRQAYRLAYSIVSIAILALVLWLARGDYPMVWHARGIGRWALLAVQGVALLGFLLTVRSFKIGEFLGLRASSDSAGGSSLTGGGFRTDGMYARCRHPLYFFTSLFFSAWPTMDLRAFIVAIWLWAYAFAGSIFEERKLVAELDQDYIAYRKRTPRLLPFGRP